MHRSVAVALALCALLASAAPAAAEKEIRLVAYGEGTTVCTVKIHREVIRLFDRNYSFRGSTECPVAVQQTAQAFGGPEVGSYCARFATTCGSSGTTEYSGVDYDISIVAPLGQGWLPPFPDGVCSGIGTDNLRCSFHASGPLYVY